MCLQKCNYYVFLLVKIRFRVSLDDVRSFWSKTSIIIICFILQSGGFRRLYPIKKGIAPVTMLNFLFKQFKSNFEKQNCVCNIIATELVPSLSTSCSNGSLNCNFYIKAQTHWPRFGNAMRFFSFWKAIKLSMKRLNILIKILSRPSLSFGELEVGKSRRYAESRPESR